MRLQPGATLQTKFLAGAHGILEFMRLIGGGTFHGKEWIRICGCLRNARTAMEIRNNKGDLWGKTTRIMMYGGKRHRQ